MFQSSRRVYRPANYSSSMEILENRSYLAAISFAAATTFATGAEPHGLAIADFNNDGKADAALSNYTAGKISILLGNGAGGFGAPTAFAAGGSVSGSTAADLNGDGNMDVVATGDDVAVLIGNGDGTLDAAVHLTAGDTPQNSTVADINADGKLDIITSNILGSFASIFKGNGDGTFQAPVNVTIGQEADIAVGDFNGDQKPDLAVARFGGLSDGLGAGIALVTGNGDGTFDPAGSFATGLPEGGRPSAIAIGDFDEDGDLDIVTANGGFEDIGGSDEISVWENNGSGLFFPALNLASGALPNDVVVADFNGDGHLDIATENSTPVGLVTIHEGKGDGTFKTPTTVAMNSGGAGIAAGDLNNDGRLEIIANNSLSDTTSVLLNTTAFASIAGGVVTVEGTAESDTFTITVSAGQIRVNRNGAVTKFTAASVTQINLSAGAGNDSVAVGANIPSTFVDAGVGNDVVVSDPSRTAALNATGAGGNDILVGGNGNDELSGANGKDRILGFGGNDYLLGGASNDFLLGGEGNDTCSGAGGKDRIFGDAGADSLLGGNGNDLIDGVFLITGVDGIDSLSGNAGTDTGVASSNDIVAGIENLA